MNWRIPVVGDGCAGESNVLAFLSGSVSRIKARVG